MGSALSCCGRNEQSNFQGEGRTLNDSRPTQGQQQNIGRTMGQEQSSQANGTSFTGAGNTLSGGNATSAGVNAEQPQPRTEGTEAAKAREERARAIEERMNKNQPTGKIGQQLSEQRRKTDAMHLADQSDRIVGARKQDAGQEARAYN